MLGANIYFVKAGIEDYTDFTVKWKGLRILKMDGFLAQGEPKNKMSSYRIKCATKIPM